MTELEQLKKENETLLKMIAIAARQQEKYAAIEAENRALKDNWRLAYAGQAMAAIIASYPSFDEKSISSMAFRVADEMIKNI